MRRALTWTVGIVAVVAIGAVSWFRMPAPEPPPAELDPASRRETPSGAVIGAVGAYGNHVWLGIPYAAPPVGPLRWRAPQPVEPWGAALEARTPAPPCPQYASPLGGVTAEPGTRIGAEDCLAVNVWAPRFAPDAVPRGDDRLPVMLWIHGGGNSIGHPSSYDGGHLAASERVVVVAPSYRLGPLGWFRHPALVAEATDAREASGNFGTLDLIHALRWVRDHVSAFGGDPNDVTVFGESAGGLNTVTMLLSPLAEGLLHRAIVQSGGTWSHTLAAASHLADAPEPGHANSAAEIALRLLVAEGTATDRDDALAASAAMNAAELAAELRAATPEALLGAYPHPGEIGMLDMPLVFRDGTVLPAQPFLEGLAQPGGAHPVPVVFGTNRDEMKLFLYADPEHVERRFGVLPKMLDPERYVVLAEYLSDLWKVTGADALAAALAPVHEPPVWVYRFDWDEQPTLLGADLATIIGAAHGMEIPFVFGHWDLGPEAAAFWTEDNAPGRERLSRAVMSYWAQLAYAGNPGRGRRGELPRWEPWGSAGSKGAFLVLDTAADGGVRMSGETLTEADLVARAASDPRLASTAERCEVLAAMADQGSAAAAAAATRAGCTTP